MITSNQYTRLAGGLPPIKLFLIKILGMKPNFLPNASTPTVRLILFYDLSSVF